MYDFGKLEGRKETIETEGPNGKFQIDILVLYNTENVEWHDLFRSKPLFDFYIALDDKDRVISMETDPEHSQIADRRIIGISAKESSGYTRGPGGTVYGKYWDGTKLTEPVLDRSEYPVLNPKQFWLLLNSIDFPKKTVLDIVEKSPQDSDGTLYIELTESTTFARLDPAVTDIISILGLDEEQFDTLWNWAAV